MEIENLRLQSEIDSIIDKIYPIGSIYMSISPTNPEETIGGAWVPWGQGKVPVGVDTSDSDFNSVERIGGEKRHTLTVDEMPKHAHPSRAVGETHTQFINDSYDHISSLCLASNSAGNNKGWSDFNTDLENVDNDFVGGSQPHNNLQPYITCYMWKRVKPGYYIDYYGGDDLLRKEYFTTFDDLKNFIQNDSNDIEDCIITARKIDTQTIQSLFNGNTQIQDVDMSNFDTSTVTNMGYLFNGCTFLNSVNLSGFDTSKVTNMMCMFYDCGLLTELDLSSFNTSNVTNMNSIFYDCQALNKLDLSSWDFSKVINKTGMFQYMKQNCEILVKDQTAKNFVLGVRSDLTNVQIKS